MGTIDAAAAWFPNGWRIQVRNRRTTTRKVHACAEEINELEKGMWEKHREEEESERKKEKEEGEREEE